MANTIDIGNATSLIIRIPARGETNWSQEFKQYFADVIADHDHTSGQGARIKNAALVTYTMVNNGDVFEDVDGNEVAYVETDVTVSTDTIQNSAVTTAKIADDAVTGAKIADNSITTNHIAPDTVIAADIATNAITEDELRDDASNDSLRAVSTNHIKDANITTAKIADYNVTAAKLNSDVVGDGMAQEGLGAIRLQLEGGDLIVVDHAGGGGPVKRTHIVADGRITTVKIADSSVTTAKIANANITTAKLNDDSVTKEKINADVAGNGIGQNVDGSLEVNVDNSTIEIDTDSLRLKDLGITTAKLADSSVTTAKIADANVTTAKIADGAITPAKVASLALFSLDTGTSPNLSAETIGTDTNIMTIMSNGGTTSYTIPSAGKYVLSMQLKLADGRPVLASRGAPIVVNIKKGNDIIANALGAWMEEDDNDDDVLYTFNRTFSFNANDVITVHFASTTALDHLYGGCFLQIVQIL